MQSDQYYLTVTDHNFDEAVINHIKPVLLFFETQWSGSCHLMDPILKRLAMEFEGRIRIGKIDADKNKKSIRIFGIYELPTILFFKNGQIIDHINGIISKNEMVARIQRNLESVACIEP